MKKLLDIGPYFGNTYEPSLQILHVGPHCLLEKRASAMSEAFNFASSMEPKEGHTYILVIAMGAGDYYGPNRNSDFFPEADLEHQYINFETKYTTNPDTNKKEINAGALFFKHHKNKVAKGNPWFGTVHKAFYNKRMHRVELIIDIHHDREGAMDLIDKVNGGGDFSVSMGVNIPHDTCNLCGNKAKKVKDYCDHLKYELGRTRPDGTRIYAINGGYDYKKTPKALNFFDISYVFRPADKTGYMLKKVAMAGNTEEVTGSAQAYEKLAEDQEKLAELGKMAEITKYFQGQATAIKNIDDPQMKVISRNPMLFDNVVSQMQTLSPEHIDKLSKYPMAEILSTLADMGILLTTPEFIQMVVKKKLGVTLPLDTLKQFTVDQAKAFKELSDNPDMVDALEEDVAMFKEATINDDIKAIVEDIRESRDLSPEGFIKKAGTSFLRSAAGLRSGPSPWADGKGMMDVEVVTDPNTGKKFYASMEAIDHSRNSKLTGSIAKTVGGGALLAALFMATRKAKGIVAPAVGMGTLALGAKLLYDNVKKSDKDGYIFTDSGEAIPGATSMIEKRSSVEKVASPGFGLATRTATTLVPMIGSTAGKKYYEDRLHTGTAGTYRTDAEKYMDNAGRIAYTHPVLTAGAGIVGGHMALNTGEAIAKAARKLLGK